MKLTISELKKIIKEEALRLYQITNLENKKIEIEEALKVLNEGTLEEVKKVNPWAICHASVGSKKDAKLEKCVVAVKKKQGIEENIPK